jgi:hypothetical protein
MLELLIAVFAFFLFKELLEAFFDLFSSLIGFAVVIIFLAWACG